VLETQPTGKHQLHDEEHNPFSSCAIEHMNILLFIILNEGLKKNARPVRRLFNCILVINFMPRKRNYSREWLTNYLCELIIRLLLRCMEYRIRETSSKCDLQRYVTTHAYLHVNMKDNRDLWRSQHSYIVRGCVCTFCIE
jgi:hypothetical protein